MASCTRVIKLAMRKLQLLASGANPTAAEGADYLEILQDFYASLVETQAFGELTDVIATADYEAGENERIRADGFTITYPLTITDQGIARPPRDLALVMVVTAGQDPARDFYDANRGEWVSLNELTGGGEAPLSSRGLDGLASSLAVYIAAENGATLDATTALSARSFKGRMASKGVSKSADIKVEYF